MFEEKEKDRQTAFSEADAPESSVGGAPIPPPIVPAPVLPTSSTDEPQSYPSFLQDSPIDERMDETDQSNSDEFQSVPAPVIPVIPVADFTPENQAEPVLPDVSDGETEDRVSPVASDLNNDMENQPESALSDLNEDETEKVDNDDLADNEVSAEAEETSDNESNDSSSGNYTDEETEFEEHLESISTPAPEPMIPDFPVEEETKEESVVPDEPIVAMEEQEVKPPETGTIETTKTEETLETENDQETEANNSPQDGAEAISDDADYKSESFLEDLFSNGNECVTVANGSFPVKDDTRALLALFSNGRFFVAEAARFDGKVLGFEYLARKRRLQIGKPEYVPTIVINDIYEYAARNATKSFIPPVVETNAQEQVRMQRDFVTIISRAAMQRVSDIHIVVADHTTVMFRVNGLMQTEMEYNKEWGESFVRAAFASADISDANYAQNEYQAAQKLGRTPLRGSGGRLTLPRNVLGIRLQFNPIAFGTRYVVMRMLYAEDDASAASNLEVLGFSKKETDIFYQMRAIPTGIVVISGPTGSGKSTTLQRNMIAMLQERDYEINLITVEDPPEYPIPGARQMPVTNAATEETKDREFTKALSAALRSDPDALMIGEVRTLSAADLAFRGALSGHNVWTTIHANSAPAILMRLKDIGVEDFKLQDPSIMKGMMAQRLFRKLCPFCRIKATDRLDHPAVQRLRQAFGDEALEKCYLRGPGCEECDSRGVKGRTVVGEFLLPDATFLDLSIRGETSKAMSYWINDLGGTTLRDNSIARMLQGIIDIEEVERWTGFLDQQVMA
ncbi:MAG: Flp pilus assembly complex ATPase component TadA [Alphaproteobacteria bacterium]|nr:Flp pilus assembly complex ATPase component TadA [Alphaproteobacteria bacterium]